MSLTEEEYQEALNYLFEQAHNCTNCDKVNIKCDDCETDNTMECDIAHYRLVNLIEQYFEPVKKTKLSEYENPQPLRFEELHENMWVWDKRDNKYVRICRTRIYEYDTGCFYKGQKLLRIYCDSGWYDTEFIENRFYKREVK